MYCNEVYNNYYMGKRKTIDEFIIQAKIIHGGKYDYSKVNYINNSTKVCIICPIHGEFWQTPNHHLSGHGCVKCGKKEMAQKIKGVDKICSRRLIYGVGVNDVIGIESYKKLKSYHVWRQMLFRCYSKYVSKRKTYMGCTVCNEWFKYSNFKKWFDENYVENWCLDKDILSHKNRKVYSPETCCFVPNEINVLFNRHKNHRSKTGIMGVQLFRGKYVATLSKYGKSKIIGSFDDINKAKDLYKSEREKYIKEVANKWKEKIKEKVYNAMINYEVQLID